MLAIKLVSILISFGVLFLVQERTWDQLTRGVLFFGRTFKHIAI